MDAVSTGVSYDVNPASTQMAADQKSTCWDWEYTLVRHWTGYGGNTSGKTVITAEITYPNESLNG